MKGTEFSELGKEFPKMMDMAQKCGITMDELNDCISAMTVLPPTPINVKNAVKDIKKVIKKLITK